jgi:peptide-methionine (S)-S-oxide reductase
MRMRLMMLAAVAAGSVAMAADAPKTESVVLAGGCFWGTQGIFEHVKGVTDTVVGYAGGKKETATYEQVEEGDTGHAESVKVTYDPSKITYAEILKIFFTAAHDPTTLNYQHNDRGPQYRSAVFFADEQQKKGAEAYIQKLNAEKVYRSPIVTQVAPLTGFYKAEEGHQHFLDRNPDQGYIVAVDIPLLQRFEEKYPQYYKK